MYLWIDIVIPNPHTNMAMPDLQRYPWKLCLIKCELYTGLPTKDETSEMIVRDEYDRFSYIYDSLQYCKIDFLNQIHK